MHPASASLRRALISAYPNHVRRRLADRGLEEPDGFEDALEEGKRWLEAALGELLGSPFAAQARSPFELFQEAMRFPTAALTHASAPNVPRDAGQVEALPGDHFDLAPASSRQLGEEVWELHLEWGVAKARALAGVGHIEWFGADLIDRSRIEAAVRAAGRELAGPDEDSTPYLALVDLDADGAMDAIVAYTAGEVRTIAYGPHVDADALRDAEAAGAEAAMPRSRFFRELPELLEGDPP